MRKALFIFISILFAFDATAAALECRQPVCPYMYTLSSSCQSLCDSGICSGVSTIIDNGVVIDTHRDLRWSACPPYNGGVLNCECSIGTVYTCDVGYYGWGYSSFEGGAGGCTICPENAYCIGGNGSWFTCLAGYYAAGEECISCAFATGEPSATSASGSNSISACYVPAGATLSDNTGNFSHSDKCYYSN